MQGIIQLFCSYVNRFVVRSSILLKGDISVCAKVHYNKLLCTSLITKAASSLIVVIKDVQELKAKNKLLENANKSLQQQNNAMEQRLQATEDMINNQNTHPGKAK